MPSTKRRKKPSSKPCTNKCDCMSCAAKPFVTDPPRELVRAVMDITLFAGSSPFGLSPTGLAVALASACSVFILEAKDPAGLRRAIAQGLLNGE